MDEKEQLLLSEIRKFIAELVCYDDLSEDVFCLLNEKFNNLLIGKVAGQD